ncbi:MFS transporter [Bacillaceae bacterium Marseille-Q3522]|nr:MFS transporter [Bacillaceae bacterium Marseille-Q3522]
MSEESLQIQHKKDKIWTQDFILICAANFFIFLGFQMTLPTIPLFVKHLGGSDQLIGLVVGVFTFSALLIRPNAGHALETKGRRFVYLTGLAIFVIAVGSYGFLPSILLLFVMRMVQGVGWGYSTTASGTIATDLIPAKKRGQGMGYFGLTASIALAFGPSLGLALAGTLTFIQLFLVCALLGLTALLLSSRIHYKKVEENEHKAVALKWDIYEKSALRPSILLFFITIPFGGIASFLPLYAVEKGVEGIQIYFLIYAAALMFTRTFAGRLYDKKGHGAVFIPGTIMIVTAMLLLSWLPNATVLFFAAFCYGIGFGCVHPALQAWSVEKAPPSRRGMANATFFSFFDLGVGIGAILFGQIAHWSGYYFIYISASISVMISVLLYLFFLWRIRKTKLA